jgi:CheY-like chemotaxis protein
VPLPPPAEMPFATPAPATNPRRALLVDDEPVIRQALRRFFQRHGWEVDEAEDGAGALDRLMGAERSGGTRESAAYTVIISDLRMPGVSGIELYERLAAERPELLERLIVSTGDSVSPEAADFLRRSSCPVLNKPFGLAELRGLVTRIVQN